MLTSGQVDKQNALNLTLSPEHPSLRRWIICFNAYRKRCGVIFGLAALTSSVGLYPEYSSRQAPKIVEDNCLQNLRDTELDSHFINNAIQGSAGGESYNTLNHNIKTNMGMYKATVKPPASPRFIQTNPVTGLYCVFPINPLGESFGPALS
ncbi:hypothetical protein TNCV_1611491 [Trichonephila clavipes]|nr:hypothetical protein TNCV_1611491 [Trichonephila clavipes]